MVRERITRPDGTALEKFERRVRPWTGLAWILERRHKPQFNKTEVIKAREGPGEGGLMTADEMLELEKLTKRMVLGPAESLSSSDGQ